MSLRILVSALSCNGSLGSEPLVGYKTVEALARDHEITVISSPPSQVPEGVRLIRCEAGPCLFNEIDAPALLRFEIRQWLAVRRLMRRERFDLIHHVTPSHIDAISLLHGFGVSMMIGPALASVPPPESFRPYLCRAIGSPRPRYHLHRIGRALAVLLTDRIRVAKRWFRPTKALIAGVPIVRDQLPPWWQGVVHDIPYAGVERDIFVPPPAKAGSETLRLLFVGRMVPYKGLELILRSLGTVKHRLAFEARFIGQSHPAYSQHLEQTARELGIADRLSFEPAVPREQLTPAYQQADVFLMPSIETYGIALLEAMSCGLPSVVADFNGPGCILPDSAGFKIPLCEPERFFAEFADALVTLHSRPELRAQMGRAARDHIVRVHDWEHIGRNVRQFVSAVFGRAHEPLPAVQAEVPGR